MEDKKFRDPLQQPDDFWIQIIVRDLTTCMEGEGTMCEPKYITSQYVGDKTEPLELTQWFYSALKKYRELEEEGEMFIFNIEAFHHEYYTYDADKIICTKKIPCVKDNNEKE